MLSKTVQIIRIEQGKNCLFDKLTSQLSPTVTGVDRKTREQIRVLVDREDCRHLAPCISLHG